MNEIFYGIVILFPILFGVLIPLIPFGSRKQMMIYIETVVVLTSLMVLALLLRTPKEVFCIIRFNAMMNVSLTLDGLGKVFAGMVAFLWPFAILYSFEYMKHEGHEKYFFMFYVLTYGITLGVAQSENLLTLYIFFEALSLITLPLIMHTLTREAIMAARTYFYFMIGGAAFAFIGMIFIMSYGTTLSFVPGGVLDTVRAGRHQNLLLFIYVMSFFGFSVKAAIFPFSAWLPKAGVAPTPVTALLHAVAVVKTGVFAAMRITYYSFGTDLLRGTWAQMIVMIFTLITILYGSSMALKETHIKRRLAWSTVSNLSYILFAVTTMSQYGLGAAMAHMVSHAFMKITAFFCAGAIMYKTGKHYIHELDGVGRQMPLTFLAMTIAGLGLMGVPGLSGFVSKWNIVEAAIASENVIAYVGVAVLLISALLTAVYMLTISMRAFCPGRGFDYASIKMFHDPNWMMIVPLVIFVIVIFAIGLHPQPLVDFFMQIANQV